MIPGLDGRIVVGLLEAILFDLGRYVVGWFVLELLLYRVWRRALGAERCAAKPVTLQRSVAFCVREVHAIGCVLMAGWAVAAVGLGLDGYYDVQACVRLPGMSRSVGFSLSWAVWEVVSVLRDLEGEGAIMLVHVAIMLSAFYIVFALGCMEHMIACNQLQEASTILLNPRLLWMELVGKEKALKSRRFRRLTAGFGALFLLVRIGFALPRTLVHVRVLGRSLAAGNGTPPSWLAPWGWPSDFGACYGASIAVVDLGLHLMQMALNLFWAYKIVVAASRARYTPPPAAKPAKKRA